MREPESSAGTNVAPQIPHAWSADSGAWRREMVTSAICEVYRRIGLSAPPLVTLTVTRTFAW